MKNTKEPETNPDAVLDRRQFLKRTAMGAAALAVGPTVLAACGTSEVASEQPTDQDGQQSSQLKVQYGFVSPTAVYWPVFVAQELGYFKELNVDFDPTVVRGSAAAFQQIVGGAIKATGASIDTAAISVEGGAPLIGISALPNTPFNFVVSDDIQTFDDLRGKKIGVTQIGTSLDGILKVMLAENGLQPGDYDVIQAGGTTERVAAIQSGAIAGGFLAQPQDFSIIDKGGTRSLGYTNEYVDIEFVGTFVDPNWAEENRDGVVRFLEAHVRAADWLADSANKEQAVAILEKSSDTEARFCAATYDLYADQGVFEKQIDLNVSGANELIEITQEARGEGQFEDAGEYFDLSYLKEAMGA